MSEATSKRDPAEEPIDKEQYEAWEAQCQDAQVKIGDIGVGDELLCMLGHVRVMAIAPLAHCTRYLVKTVLLNGCLAEEEQSFLANPSDLLDQVDDIIWVKRGGQTIYQKPAIVNNPSKFYGMGQPTPLTCAIPEDPWVGIEDCPAEWKDGRVVLGYDDSVSVSNGSHGLYPIFWAETLYGRREGLFWATDDIHQEPFSPVWVRPMVELPAGRRKSK